MRCEPIISHVSLQKIDVGERAQSGLAPGAIPSRPSQATSVITLKYHLASGMASTAGTLTA